MLHGCMLEYQKGKTREHEKKNCCPLLATRGFDLSCGIMFYHIPPTHTRLLSSVTTTDFIHVVKYCTQ